jgi:hypothetical protein
MRLVLLAIALNPISASQKTTLSMSVASAAVAMSGSVIMYLSCLVRFLRRRGQDFHFGFCREARCPGACSAPADAAAFCSVGDGLTGVALLALDFVGA